MKVKNGEKSVDFMKRKLGFLIVLAFVIILTGCHQGRHYPDRFLGNIRGIGIITSQD